MALFRFVYPHIQCNKIPNAMFNAFKIWDLTTAFDQYCARTQYYNNQINAAMQVNPEAKTQNSLANVSVNNSPPNLMNLPIISMNSNTHGIRSLFNGSLQVCLFFLFYIFFFSIFTYMSMIII